MKKLILAAVLASLSTVALADGNIDTIVQSNNQVSVAAVQHTLHYHELDSTRSTGDTYLDSEMGSQNGYRVDGKYQADLFGIKNVFVAGSYQHASGNTDYIGHLQDGTPYDTTTVNKFDDFDLRIGKGIVASDNVLITPYVEAGARHWDRDVAPGNPAGISETYKHTLVGIGTQAQYAPVDNLVLTADAGIGYTVSPTIDVNTFGQSMDLGTSNVVHVGLAADYAVTKAVHVNAGVEAKQFRYDQSNVVSLGGGSMWEPDSKTQEVNGYIGVGYAF